MSDPYAAPDWYDPASLVSRLRGIYNTPITDGLGPIDGKMVVTKEFPGRPQIQIDAAAAIEGFEQNHFMDARKVELLIEELKKPADPLGCGQLCIVPIHREAMARLKEFVSPKY